MLHKKRLIIVTLIIVILALPVTVLAGSSQVGPYIFNFPDDYESCTPADNVWVKNVPTGLWVQFLFGDANTGDFISNTLIQSTGGDVIFNVPYEGRTGHFFISFIIHEPLQKVRFTAKWTVTCTPPPELEGCTPGYWKNHIDSWVGYSPGDDFETVFGVDASFDPDTLLDALNKGGGGEYALARHAVGALLNSTNPGVDYPYTTAEVIDMVQEAYSTGDFEDIKDEFESANEAFCPLD